jgi:lipoate-protein ligase A
VTDEGKISGATLKRKNGAIYLGGTLLYEVDAEKMFSVLTPPEDKMKDKPINDYRERVSSVSRQSSADFQQTVTALRNALLSDKQFEKGDWTEEEMDKAGRLADKYSSEEWLYRDD